MLPFDFRYDPATTSAPELFANAKLFSECLDFIRSPPVRVAEGAVRRPVEGEEGGGATRRSRGTGATAGRGNGALSSSSSDGGEAAASRNWLACPPLSPYHP